MKFPLVRELAALGFPVRLTCGVLGFSAQVFSKWCSDPVSPRDHDDAHLVDAIRDVHSDDPEFGDRFISDELERAGHRVGERRVWRLCSEHKIWSTTTKKGRKGAAAPRTGGARRPRAAELHRSRAGSGVADGHHRAQNRGGQALRLRHQRRLSNRIVGYATSDRMTANLATSALRQAVARRQPTGTVVVHPD